MRKAFILLRVGANCRCHWLFCCLHLHSVVVDAAFFVGKTGKKIIANIGRCFGKKKRFHILEEQFRKNLSSSLDNLLIFHANTDDTGL